MDLFYICGWIGTFMTAGIHLPYCISLLLGYEKIENSSYTINTTLFFECLFWAIYGYKYDFPLFIGATIGTSTAFILITAKTYHDRHKHKKIIITRLQSVKQFVIGDNI